MDQQVILVVDDSPELRAVFSVVLGHAGYTVVEAEDGDTGVALARERSPRLVLMDLHMPGPSGWEALRRLRDDAATASVPVVAVTSEDLRADLDRIREAGFCGYVKKPILPRDLLEMVRLCLQHRPEGGSWVDLPSFDVPPLL